MDRSFGRIIVLSHIVCGVQIIMYSQAYKSLSMLCCASTRSNPQGNVFVKVNFLSKLTLS